ncbi:MAG: hypothetical protein GSR78_02810 [Desulfurococcales archaeon]|nr:hypothetical protein [Desulfurococcales archaeon]
MRLVYRLTHKEVAHSGLARLGPAGLAGYLGSGGETTIEVYSIRLHGIIATSVGFIEPVQLRDTISIAGGPWRSYCRWHDGPLDRRDNPLERAYCPMEADGFCGRHKRSERALYDACMSGSGWRSLEACRKLDKTIRTEYAVYMLDYGGQKPKVGATRLFRFRDRIAEQPHTVATLLAVTDSALQARRIETALRESGIAVERPRRRTQVVMGNLAAAASRLSSAAEKAARVIGVDWRGTLFRVEPPDTLENARTVDPRILAGARLRLSDYWGGLLVLESPQGLVAVSEKELLHRDSLAAEDR